MECVPQKENLNSANDCKKKGCCKIQHPFSFCNSSIFKEKLILFSETFDILILKWYNIKNMRVWRNWQTH